MTTMRKKIILNFFLFLFLLPQAGFCTDFNDLLPILSPAKENFLQSTFPKTDLILKLLPSPFQAEAFGMTRLPEFNTRLDETQLKIYDGLIEKLQRDDDFDTSHSVTKIQRQFFIGDLMTEVAVHGIDEWVRAGRISDGRRYLARLMQQYPSSPYTARTSYHLAMILLEQKE